MFQIILHIHFSWTNILVRILYEYDVPLGTVEWPFRVILLLEDLLMSLHSI